ncbi:MAG: hypothetical protein ACYS8Z_04730 [Planctomycetota bacterium]|jgi:hypothetical protein
MAIVILGKTVCGICGRVIFEEDKCTSFSTFVNNEKDPLFFFNDAAFHTECIKKHELGSCAIKRQNELWKLADPQKRDCFICQKSIDDPDEYFSFGFLPSEEFYEMLPFRKCHRGCLESWRELQETYEKLAELQESGKWDGKGPVLELRMLKEVILQKGK